MSSTLENLRKESKSDLLDLVKMHLSFLIEVTTDEWDKIVKYVEDESYDNENRCSHNNKAQGKFFTTASSASSITETSSNSYKVNSKFAPPKEKELASNIFGQPLSFMSISQAMIMVDFLNQDDNFKFEGIFRKSGTQARQQDLRYMLNNGARVDIKANRFTAIDVSCVLKEFIQKLPEPLLTTNHFELYYELALAIRRDTPEGEIENKNAKRLKIIQLLLHLLPEINRTFFISLMNLLNKVARSLEITKMDERSLALIFGQHILCPRTWTPKQIQKNIDIITDAMEFLLINHDKLFSGPNELVLDAKKKLKKLHHIQEKSLSGGDGIDALDSHQEEGDENDTVITFCERRSPHDTITDQALAELYAQVQAMPETPQKRKYIKQFNKQNGLGTPMNVTNSARHGTSSKWRSMLPNILRPKH